MSIRSDVLAITTGWGSVRIVAGSADGRGLWDDGESQVEVGDGNTVLVRTRTLRVATAAFPDLAAEDTIQVGDLDDDDELADYRVIDVQRWNDGTETLISVGT